MCNICSTVHYAFIRICKSYKGQTCPMLTIHTTRVLNVSFFTWSWRVNTTSHTYTSPSTRVVQQYSTIQCTTNTRYRLTLTILIDIRLHSIDLYHLYRLTLVRSCLWHMMSILVILRVYTRLSFIVMLLTMTMSYFGILFKSSLPVWYN